MKAFTGVYTALITPFTPDGAIDWQAFERLIEFQIAGKVDGLVIMGTTGESSTIDCEEHKKIIAESVRIANGRTQIIAGTGSNSTHEAIQYSVSAEKSGADALLQVSPYYNKPTQEGLFQHFSAVADAVSLPIILYNVPGRTGVNIETETILRLIKKYPEKIAGVKDASGNLDQVREVIAKTPEDFCVLSGNDDQNFEIINMGGDGAISVLSNIFPKETGKIVREKNAALAEKFSDFSHILFCEANPIPVKAVAAEMKLCENILRLPLTPLSEENKKQVMAEFEKVRR